VGRLARAFEAREGVGGQVIGKASGYNSPGQVSRHFEGEMAHSSDLPDDLRKQIEDALAAGQAERLPGEPRRAPPPRPSRLPDPRPRSPSQLLLISALVALAAWVFHSTLPYSREVLWLGLAGVAVALLSLLLRPRGRPHHYWRGRPVDLPPENWTDRLYGLLYRG